MQELIRREESENQRPHLSEVCLKESEGWRGAGDGPEEFGCLIGSLQTHLLPEKTLQR